MQAVSTTTLAMGGYVLKGDFLLKIDAVVLREKELRKLRINFTFICFLFFFFKEFEPPFIPTSYTNFKVNCIRSNNPLCMC